MRVGGAMCSMRTPNPIAIAACSISSSPMETISPARGLSRTGWNSARCIRIPSRPTKTSPSITARKNG